MATETKPAYSPGLAGVIAGETEICWVDPNAGLMYRGYDIHEMAEKASFRGGRLSAAQWRVAQCEAAEGIHATNRQRTRVARSR